VKILPGDGYFAGTASANGELTIGGRCSSNGAISPNTGLPLTQFACVRLNPESFCIPGWPMPEIHFLYSWKCRIHEGDFSYRYVNGDLEVVEFCKGVGDSEGFPYDDYPVQFDEIRLQLQRMTKEDQSIIIELNDPDCDPDLKYDNERASDLSEPMHQFGGMPYLISPEETSKDCVICGCEMFLTASIGNNSHSNNEGFSGNDFVQVVYWTCPECHVVSARNFCD